MPLNFLAPPDNIRDDHAMEPHDAGWRKYILVLISMALLLWGFWWTGAADVSKEILERRSVSYVTFSEFLLALVGLYFGANVGYKWAAGTTNVKAMATKAPEPAKTGVEGSGKATLD